MAEAFEAPATMDELVKRLNEAMGDGGLTDLDEKGLARVQALMASYKSKEADWKKYAHFDAYKYTRNLVDDGNGKFNLLVLCWGEGQASAIHDHAGSHCLMKVLDGEVTETRYAWPETDTTTGTTLPLRCTTVTTLERDQVAYVHDNIGLHRVENPSHTHGSLTLHLYTPPYSECRTFNEDSGKARASGRMCFYSVKGERVPPLAASTPQ